MNSVKIHKADSRGKMDYGWLKTNHSFSFSNYFNPDNVHFGVLRVLNDDLVEAGHGFASHPHDNMEIITFVESGELVHKDNLGNEKVIHEGQVQLMSAGTGIVHSEYNNSRVEDLKFLQIWIFPKKKNVIPKYEEKFFDVKEHNKLILLASPNGYENSILINQDAYISTLKLDSEQTLSYTFYDDSNGLYIFNLSGDILVNDNKLETRDAISFNEKNSIFLRAISDSKLLLLEVPMKLEQLN